MKSNTILIAIITLIIGGGIGFFVGQKYPTRNQSNFNPQFQNRGNRMSGRQIVGEILDQDDKSITVKLQDGSTKIVFVSDTTNINKAQEASKSDLKAGERVGVFGAINSDGSVTAQNIQLNPIFRNPTGGAKK